MVAEVFPLGNIFCHHGMISFKFPSVTETVQLSDVGHNPFVRNDLHEFIVCCRTCYQAFHSSGFIVREILMSTLGECGISTPFMVIGYMVND